MSSSSTESVRGVWKRLFEEDLLGDEMNADRSTLVLWTQAPKSGIYVDIRLPEGSLGRQDRGKDVPRDPLALTGRGTLVKDLSDEEKAILLRQKSFAGTLQFSLGDTTESKEALAKDTVLAGLAKQADSALPLCTCFWKREIDYQPPTGGLDIGVCAAGQANSDGSIDMRETGDDASYAEGWHRLVGSEQGPFLACQLLTENGVNRSGFWVRTGRFFAYAVGRPNNSNEAESLGCSSKSPDIQSSMGKTLEEAVRDRNLELDSVGSYVCVYGEVLTYDGIDSTWKILHSTDPSLVNCELMGLGSNSCSTLILQNEVTSIQEGSIFNQIVGSKGCTRTWKVMEISDGLKLPGLS